MTATRNSADSDDDDDDFPDIDELLSGIMQKNNSASANPNGDGDGDDSFLDIDELLSGIKEKSISASADTNSGGMAKKVDGGTRGGRSTDSSCSTAGSTQGEHPASLNLAGLLTHMTPDPIILSDDESVGAESETDYSDLGVGLTAKSDSGPPHATDSGLVDGDGFGSGTRTALTPDHLVADHQDGDDTHNNGVVDNTQLWLPADRPRPASPGRGYVTRQPSKLQVNTDIPQGSPSSVDLDGTNELEGKDSDVPAEGDGEDSDDTRFTKGRRLSAVPDNHPAFDDSISQLQDGQPDYPQSPQPGPAAAFPRQPDLKNDHLRKHRRRRGATRNIRRKRPRTTAHIRLASTGGTASAALESSYLDEAQPCTQITAPDQEMVDGGSADDSDDEDYDDKSAAAGSERGRRPRSRKRVRRTEDTEDNDVEPPPTRSLGVSSQTAAATLSGSIQESDEIPIHGYFTLKTIGSKVVYSLTFSQELLPEPSGTWQRRDIARSVSSSSDRRDSERSPMQERAMNRPVKNSRFSSEDDALLLQLKGEGLSWDEILVRFPERSKGTLQVHYSTKLKRRSETSKTMRKRRRNE